MKLLFDQNLSFRLCVLLSDLFPASAHVRGLDLHTADDVKLWNYARANGYVLVSLDADFAEMAALNGAPPKVIWLRHGNRPTAFVAERLRSHFAIIRSFEQDEAACLEIY
jgi:predicted nuclease of predicted toxin-antitoxin system